MFRFQRGKTESLFLQRKNPRRIAWTVLFRRQHKKGISEVSTSLVEPSKSISERAGWLDRRRFKNMILYSANESSTSYGKCIISGQAADLPFRKWQRNARAAL